MFESANFERSFPWIIASIGGVLAATAVLTSATPSISKLGELFAAAINVAGIAIGFIATMKAILLGIKQTRTVRNLRRANRWRSILTKARRAIMWSFFVAMLSAIVLVLEPTLFTKSALLNLSVFTLWGFLVGGAIGSAYLIIDILFAIVGEDEPVTGAPDE